MGRPVRVDSGLGRIDVKGRAAPAPRLPARHRHQSDRDRAARAWRRFSANTGHAFRPARRQLRPEQHSTDDPIAKSSRRLHSIHCIGLGPPPQISQRLATIAAVLGIAALARKQPFAIATTVLALPLTQPSPADQWVGSWTSQTQCFVSSLRINRQTNSVFLDRDGLQFCPQFVFSYPPVVSSHKFFNSFAKAPMPGPAAQLLFISESSCTNRIVADHVPVLHAPT